MCEPVTLTTAAVGFVQKKQVDKAAQQQQDAMDAQMQANADAINAMSKLGRSPQRFEVDNSAQLKLKSSKTNMQQGILGTLKSNPLSMNAPAATQKVTLGT